MRSRSPTLEADRLELLMNATGRAFFDWDGGADAVTWAGACQDLLGRPAGELAGGLDDWLALAHPDDRAALAEAVERARAAHGPFRHEFRARRKEGGCVAVLCEGRFLPGTPARLVDMLSDVSERRLSDDQLRRAKDAAEAATRAKSAFLANMSHELRTPLNGVIGMVNLLARTNLDGQQRRYTQAALASADLLLSLLSNILDLSKIEAGRLELEAVNFSVAEVVEGVAASMTLAAEEKNLALDCLCAPGVVPPLCGDPTRLRQVLVNLVGNAIKFTPSGTVTLSAAVEQETPRGAVARFEVRDTGIGIPPESQGRLFETFTQVDTSTTRKFGGSGLGLAICKQLVLKMGGAIGVQSVPGEGSVFWFTVRLARPAAAAPPVAPSAPAAPAAGASDSRRVLLVEDNDINAEVVREVLADAGYPCDRVPTGAAAIVAARARPYGVILMDCQLPELDGFEAARCLRAGGLRVPIIALTAGATREDRERCRAAGMDDYLSKPLRPDQLLRLLEAHVGGPPAADLEAAVARLEGRGEFLRRLAARFLAGVGEVMESIRTAAARGDFRGLATLAHRLRGEAATFDARRVVRCAEDVEAAAHAGDAAAAGERLARLAGEVAALREELERFVEKKVDAG